MNISHDKKWHQFKMHTDNGAQVGFIEYEPVKRGLIRAVSTHVYPEYEGKGYAGALLDAMVDYAKEKGMKIKPECSYVKHAFEKNREKYADVKEAYR